MKGMGSLGAPDSNPKPPICHLFFLSQPFKPPSRWPAGDADVPFIVMDLPDRRPGFGRGVVDTWRDGTSPLDVSS